MPPRRSSPWTGAPHERRDQHGHRREPDQPITRPRPHLTSSGHTPTLPDHHLSYRYWAPRLPAGIRIFQGGRERLDPRCGKERVESGVRGDAIDRRSRLTLEMSLTDMSRLSWSSPVLTDRLVQGPWKNVDEVKDRHRRMGRLVLRSERPRAAPGGLTPVSPRTRRDDSSGMKCERAGTDRLASDPLSVHRSSPLPSAMFNDTTGVSGRT